MAADAGNSHHDLIKNMGQVGDTREQSDFLTQVAAVSGGGEPEAPAPDMPVGQRVRMLREQKGLSHQDLAQRTGLEEEYLVQVEQAEVSPPLGVLIKLGKGLDMKLGTLIAGGEDRPYTVVRRGEGTAMSRFASQRGTKYGYTYQALAPNMQNRFMEPFIVVLQKTDEEVPLSSHDGQEFIFVLDGKMEALVGEAREVLEPGDCIYYQSTTPHLVRPANDGPTRILAVIYGGG
jgi:mannose-6-phosphate isomerase-like protein (cupin superfamily)/DNA-binding XRE family transcriptional regulator